VGLNAASVGARLAIMAKAVRGAKKRLKAAGQANKKECKSSLHSVSDRFHDFTLRLTHARRTLKAATKISKRRAVVIARANEELGNYRRFAAFNRANKRNWKTFWGTTIKGVKVVSGLIARIRTHISSLHRQNKKSALIELPTSYTTALSEITAEFENNMDNLGGLRPVITNLLEIIKDKKHLRKKNSRKQLRHFLGRLAEKFHDNLNTFEEENEHQVGLFDGLTSLFDDSVTRSKRILAGLTALQKTSASKLAWLTASVRGSEHLAESSKNIVDLKAQECRSIRQVIQRTKLKYARFLNTVGQVQEVLSDRFGSLKSFIEETSNAESN